MFDFKIINILKPFTHSFDDTRFPLVYLTLFFGFIAFQVVSLLCINTVNNVFIHALFPFFAVTTVNLFEHQRTSQ